MSRLIKKVTIRHPLSYHTHHYPEVNEYVKNYTPAVGNWLEVYTEANHFLVYEQDGKNAQLKIAIIPSHYVIEIGY